MISISSLFFSKFKLSEIVVMRVKQTQKKEKRKKIHDPHIQTKQKTHKGITLQVLNQIQ